MDDASDESRGRTIPVDPPVHVETFATHCTLTWTADGLPAFLAGVRALECLSPSDSVVTDRRDTAGRQRRELSDVGAVTDAIRYLRVEPPTPWTLSWERRTWPVVSVSGTPPPEPPRDLHRATTNCAGWDDGAFAALENVTASYGSL
jgi:hypothetical protein